MEHSIPAAQLYFCFFEAATFSCLPILPGAGRKPKAHRRRLCVRARAGCGTHCRVDCHCQRHKTQRGISATVSYCNTCIHGPPVGEWMPAKGPPTHSIFQQVAASPSSQGALANARRGMARCDFVRRSFYTVSPAKRNGRCLSRGRSFLGAVFRMQRLDV
ncbi:hypothetical protein V8C40DRAFT_236601 [Trichoderma camerunense]